MAIARASLVDTATTPYYHCVTRCVRRAFLCGKDPFTARNFNHRKRWIITRLRQLASTFCIDICAYAVMSNHVHLVLRIDSERGRRLTEEEVSTRYGGLFRPSILQLRGLPRHVTEARLAVYRRRLYDLSWFMRCLNEFIARRANQEDGCTGKFWEARFRSQALLDEAAVLTCMSYVDLNPVRAGIAHSLEHSDFTSIQARIDRREQRKRTGLVGPQLVKFTQRSSNRGILEGGTSTTGPPLPLIFEDYVALVTWSGQSIRDDKPGSLPAQAENLLKQFGVSEHKWIEGLRNYGRAFCHVVGHVTYIDGAKRRLGLRSMKGSRWARQIFCSRSAPTDMKMPLSPVNH